MRVAGSLPAGLQSSALHWPNKIAISAGSDAASFSDIWIRANAFATALRRQSIEPGDRVALILDGCWQYVVAYYGAMLAGAIVVPLNTLAKTNEVLGWITHAGARVVVIDSQTISAASVRASITKDVRIIEACTDRSEFDVITRHGEACECSPPDPMSPAAIHYTSGTTGNPKGVLLTHHALASNAHAIIEYLQLSPSDSIVSVLPFYYAYGSSVLHTHLLTGAKVIAEKGFAFPHSIVQRIADEHATGFAGVPSTYALLLSRVALDKYDLSALRYVTQAGGHMASDLTSKLAGSLPSAKVFVMYGQTEATSRISFLPPERLADKLGSVGVPVSGMHIEIRDEANRRVASGVKGNVWVAGPSVMLAYWRNPELTATTLVDGWLNTGDIGHIDKDGYLYLAGRRNDIIKVGAHRIHPQDVEEEICRMEGIQEVAVIGAEDPVLGEVVKAFVVRKDGYDVSEREIQRHCLSFLAPYKVPKFVTFIQALPRTGSGKVRRQALISGEIN